MKPGYKTSELYVTLAASIVGLLVVYGVISEGEGTAWLAFAGAVVAALPAAVYTISRAYLKAKEDHEA